MKRAYSLLTIKSADDETRTITGIATTPSIDGMGDVVEPKGAQYTLPMPFLFHHDSRQPVGNVTKTKVTADGIEVEIKLAKIEEEGKLKDRLDEAWQSIKAGLVRGLSIGFSSIESARIDGTQGMRYIKWAWRELSAVTIPANQDCNIQTIKSIDEGLLAATGHKQRGVVMLDQLPGDSGTKPQLAKGEFFNTRKEDEMTYAEQIAALQATRAAKAARMDEVMQKSLGEGRSTDSNEAEEFDTLAAELTTIDEDIVRLGKLEKMNIAKAAPVEGTTTKQATEARAGVVVKNTQKLAPGIEFARYAMCLGNAKGNIPQALEIAKSRYPDNEDVVLSLKAAVAAGTTTDSTWAAPLVDSYQRFAGDFVEFLRPQTILGRFGVGGIPSLRRVPFNVSISGQTSGGSGYWVGEGAPKPLTKFDFNAVNLRWAKVANIAVITEELLRFSNPAAESLVRDALAAALIERMDIDFIDPTKAVDPNISPASITNGLTPVNATGTGTADNIRTDVKALFAKYIAANMTPTTGVWIMSATTALALSMMTNALGQPEFPGIGMNGGTFWGMPVIVSEYVTGDSSGSIVILANASDIYLADDGQVVIDASREASLQMLDNPSNNPTGDTVATSMVSMFQTNSVAIRAERWINWVKRRSTAVAYLDQVNWGAASGA